MQINSQKARHSFRFWADCILKKPSTTLSIRISYELWEKMSEFAKKNDLDFSSGTRQLIDYGLWVDNHKKDIQDPEKTCGVISEWTAKMTENEIVEWPKELPDEQISAAMMSLQMEIERRNKL